MAITSWVNGHIISGTTEVTDLLGSAEQGARGTGFGWGRGGGSRPSRCVQGVPRGPRVCKAVDLGREDVCLPFRGELSYEGMSQSGGTRLSEWKLKCDPTRCCDFFYIYCGFSMKFYNL